MAQVLIEGFFTKRFKTCECIESVHNYIDFSDMVVRKGAISAPEGKLVIIPMNMRDGSILARGKGNADWNFSAPHGAGRLLSRGEAKEVITLDEYKTSMKGIYSTSIHESTIDESPMAYKPMEEIIPKIGDTVEVLAMLKPVYNYKGGS
jgi:tRNA-splicing ligase RtcB (3'-phosphate/5'-hydroxy nucleic acid ligase)